MATRKLRDESIPTRYECPTAETKAKRRGPLLIGIQELENFQNLDGIDYDILDAENDEDRKQPNS